MPILKTYSISLNILPIQAIGPKQAITKVRKMFNMKEEDNYKFNEWLNAVHQVQALVTEEGKVVYEYIGDLVK